MPPRQVGAGSAIPSCASRGLRFFDEVRTLRIPMAVKGKERWGSRIGVILAVAGSAVGLGNFLRFPGQAAENGGGAFMLAYFISLLIIGLPICWAEWTMGRYGGGRGYNSAPGVFYAITKSPVGKYVGVIGVIIPVVIYMYYVVIEAWCLGYAINFLTGTINFETAEQSGEFFGSFVGIGDNGSGVSFTLEHVGFFLLFCFVLNFVLIYRGISKGIEWFCNYAMPALVVMAIIVLIRVLTLGAPDGNIDRSVNEGLGFLWNPDKTLLEEQQDDGSWKSMNLLLNAQEIADARAAAAENPKLRVEHISIWEGLLNANVWLAAAGQIFFSLSIGFGVIITYSSYLRERDDVVLSGLSATSANEFCEVGLGGLITVTAGVAFLGVAGVAGQGTFGLGFNVLPLVFSQMPFGQAFGFAFFFLLFLAAVTSSLSMLQPGIAFLEESLGIGRKQSVAMLGFITGIGALFVWFFSKDLKALDTMDFWVGTFLIFILATSQIIIFSWVFGVNRGLEEAHKGSAISIPGFFKPIMLLLCPLFLILIFGFWFLQNIVGFNPITGAEQMSGYIKNLFVEPDLVAWLSVVLILLVGLFVVLLVSISKAYKKPVPEKADDGPVEEPFIGGGS